MATSTSEKEAGNSKSLRDTLLGFINDAMLPFVQKAGITMPQLQLLRMLEQKPHTSQELAQRLCVSPSAVTQLVDKLVAKNLVSRMKQPPNLRIVWLQSTPQGLKVLSEFEEIIGKYGLTEKLMESSNTIHPTVTIDFPGSGGQSGANKAGAANKSPARTEQSPAASAAKPGSGKPAAAPATPPEPAGTAPPEPHAVHTAPRPALQQGPQPGSANQAPVNSPHQSVTEATVNPAPAKPQSHRASPASNSAQPHRGKPEAAANKPESSRQDIPRDYSRITPGVDKPLAKTVELKEEEELAEKKPPAGRKSLRMSDYYQMIRRNIKK